MTGGAVLAAVEAAGGRAWLEDGRLRLAPGKASPALLATARAHARELAEELRRRRGDAPGVSHDRVVKLLASRRRVSAALDPLDPGVGLSPHRTELARVWLDAARAYGGGAGGWAAVQEAEAALLAWAQEARAGRSDLPSRIVGEDDDDEGPRPRGFRGIADRITFRTRPEGEERERDAWFQATPAAALPLADLPAPTEATHHLITALAAEGCKLVCGDGGVWCWGQTRVLGKHRAALEAELHRLAAWLRAPGGQS